MDKLDNNGYSISIDLNKDNQEDLPIGNQNKLLSDMAINALQQGYQKRYRNQGGKRRWNHHQQLPKDSQAKPALLTLAPSPASFQPLNYVPFCEALENRVWTELHLAIVQKDFVKARQIINENPFAISGAEQYAPLVDGGFSKSYKGFTPARFESFLKKCLKNDAFTVHGPSIFVLAVKSGSCELVEELAAIASTLPHPGYRAEMLLSHHLEVYKSSSNNGVWTLDFKEVNAMSTAIENNDVAMVRLLLKLGISPTNCGKRMKGICSFPGEGTATYHLSSEKEDKMSYSPLVLANGNDELYKLLIAHNMHRNEDEISKEIIEIFKKYEKDNLPALHNSIIANDFEAFKLLLKFGSDPYQSCEDYLKTAWHFAHVSPNKDFLDYLFNRNPLSELHQAILAHDLALVRKILKNNPNEINRFAPFKDGGWMVYKEGSIAIGSLLNNSPLSFSEVLVGANGSLSEFARGPSPLTMAIQDGSIEIVRELLLQGATVDAQHFEVTDHQDSADTWQVSGKIITPLSAAIESGNLEIIQLLIDSHPNNVPVLQLLDVQRQRIVKGNRSRTVININYTVNEWQRLSSFALALDNDQVLGALICAQCGKKQIDPEILEIYRRYEKNGIPAIHNCIISNDLNSFRLLLDHGANSNEKYEGKTVWQRAMENPNPEFFNLLRTGSPEDI